MPRETRRGDSSQKVCKCVRRGGGRIYFMCGSEKVAVDARLPTLGQSDYSSMRTPGPWLKTKQTVIATHIRVRWSFMSR